MRTSSVPWRGTATIERGAVRAHVTKSGKGVETVQEPATGERRFILKCLSGTQI